MIRRLALAVVAASVLAMAGDTTPARAALTFEAVSASDLVRQTVSTEPAVLVSNLVDLGALTAQARLTSLGDSTAYASSPYPGELLTVAPGLANSLTSLPVDLPQYPLIATTTYPATAHQDVGAATLNMTADSHADDSSASVHDGASSANASVTVDRAAQVVTASADATLGSFQVGSFMSVGGVRASARVTRGADGQLVRQSDFSVAAITVLGQQVRLGQSGLELAGSSVPLGLGAAVDPLASLLASLASRGVTMRVVDARDTEEGVQSGGLEISQTVDTGINGIVGTLTTTIGRLSVSVSGRATSFGQPSGPLPSSALPSLPAGSESGPSARPSTVPSSSSTSNASGSTPVASAVEGSPVSSLRPELADGGRFYPVLVLVAAAMAAVMDVFRKRGVRLTWLS